MPRRTRAAKGTPITRSAEGRCDRLIATLALAGCGDPAYPQRHGRAAFPSALRRRAPAPRHKFPRRAGIYAGIFCYISIIFIINTAAFLQVYPLQHIATFIGL